MITGVREESWDHGSCLYHQIETNEVEPFHDLNYCKLLLFINTLELSLPTVAENKDMLY